MQLCKFNLMNPYEPPQAKITTRRISPNARERRRQFWDEVLTAILLNSIWIVPVVAASFAYMTR